MAKMISSLISGILLSRIYKEAQRRQHYKEKVSVSIGSAYGNAMLMGNIRDW